MGMFDEVFIVGKVRCPNCNERVNYRKGEKANQTRWQTKDIGYPCMDLYKIEGGRMFKCVGTLPEYKSIWTKEDAEAHNKELEDKWGDSVWGNGIMSLWTVEEGDERLLDGHHDMKAKEWKSMGELPHQWVNAYTHCENCPDGSVDVFMKFTDGVLMEFYEEYRPYDTELGIITTRGTDAHYRGVQPGETE